MYNKILVATDGSDYSHRALIEAVERARRYQSEIILLFVFKQPRNYGTFSGLSTVEYSEEQINEISKKIFEATLKDVDVSGVTIHTKVRIGKTAVEIVDEAKEVDTIVMGSRGHSTVQGVVIGSVTQKVLSLTTRPVMIVK